METKRQRPLARFSRARKSGKMIHSAPPFKFLFYVFAFVFPLSLKAQTEVVLPNSPSIPWTSVDHKAEAENLWASIDWIKFKKEIGAATGLSPADVELFLLYLQDYMMKESISFFQQAMGGKIDQSGLPQYVENLKNALIGKYPEFSKVKNDFLLNLESEKNKALSYNGPCENMGFEDGSFKGWSGQYGTHKISNNQAVLSNPNTGFALHCIMSPGMTDPYVPGLSVIPPGGTHSVRLGNVIAGGQSAIIRQTFRVDSSNMVFTYKYAVVLEDPQDDNKCGGLKGGHSDAQRPYFKARLLDASNKEITCANYTVVVQPGLSGFTEVCAGGGAQMPNYFVNTGCPVGAPGYDGSGEYDGGPTTSPGSGGCTCNDHDVYYRDWTTVSIILDAYLGSNVTIEFVAADCEPRGHFGYAYVAAECNPLSLTPPPVICSGRETKTLIAPPGFKSYAWTGPGIVSGANNDTLTINKAGTYTVTIIPYSDFECPKPINFVVKESCPPRPFTETVCETTQGSGKATVNLTQYNAEVIKGIVASNVKVASWHTALPATAANQIANPAAYSVSNNQTVYANITYTNGSDHSDVTFKVLPLPVITFPDIPVSCVGSPAFSITGVTPAGGTFGPAASNVTATGIFNPSTVGTFNITYTYKDINGCTNNAVKPAVVQAKPTVDAGPSQNYCENVTSIQLAGTVTNATGGTWTGGAGTFNASASVLTPTYKPAPAEVKAGSVTLVLTTTGTGVCPPVSDNVVFKFEKLATANAGPDQDFCANTTSVPLSGTVTNATGFTWATSGNGTFSPATSLTGSYLPSATDVNQGSVTLTLKTTGNVLCPATSDIVVLTFGKIPTADAGPDKLLCEDIADIALEGAVTNATGAAWTTSGSGSFLSGPAALTGKYKPSAADINAGSVTLTLTSTGSGSCPPASDKVVFTFEKLPLADAGINKAFCASVTSIPLNASVTNASGFTWSGGSGTFSPANSLTGAYLPSVADVNAGSVTLTLKTTGNKACPASTDIVAYTFEKIPDVDAGSPELLCETSPSVKLAGAVVNATGGTWSGGSGSFSPGKNALTGTYTPTQAEIEAGSVTLMLTTTGTIYCAPVSDNVTFSFEKLPAADAGPDKALCASVTSVNLAASVSNASNWAWSGGNGTFSPQSNSLTGTYTASSSEVANGAVTLTLTTSGNKVCPAATDQVTFTFEPVPVADAGPDVEVCENNILINLGGSVTNAAGGIWSGGNGSYSPDNTSLGITYVPTAAEISSGQVALNFTTYGTKICPPYTDQVVVKITPAPTVNAGPDQIVCSNASTVQLAGTVTVATGGIWSNG